MTNNRPLFIRAALAVLALAFIYYIKDVLPPIIISLFLFYILNPIVVLLSNKRPKGLGLPLKLSIFIAFAVAFAAIYLFFRFVIPPISFEFKHFGGSIPHYVDAARRAAYTLREWYAGFGLPYEIQNAVTQGVQGVIDSIVAFAEQTVKTLLSVMGRFLQLIIIPILVYYLLKDKKTIKEGLLDLVPSPHRPKMQKILTRINFALNSYVKGVGILCLVVGTAATTGLYLLGVKYFLVLGLIAGVTEAIPFVGPWIGGIPAVTVAFLVSPAVGIQVLILYLAIQLLENTLLVPKVLGVQLELHPVAIIVAILILGKLMGGWGLFFAAPIVAILRIIYQEIQEG